MSATLNLTNHQRIRAIDLRLLRRVIRTLLRDLLQKTEFELSVCLIGAAEMTRLNETFLQHEGSTDVITFDYGDPPERRTQAPRSPEALPPLRGEIFVCVDEALLQARRFRVPSQTELVRYVVHGLLHLCGHDDQTPGARRKMKQAEYRLVRQIARQFSLKTIRQVATN